jgi:hypothetical protein
MSTVEYIYVLRLEDNCWYVGRTENVQKRLDQHMSGTGSAWTKLHRPLEVVMEKTVVGFWDEDNKVKSLMTLYGKDKVRGGSYSQIELPDYQLKALDTEFIHALNLCFKCGKKDITEKNA